MNWINTIAPIINDLTKISPTIIVAIIAATGTYLVARLNKGSTSEISLINELQEENVQRKEEIKELEKDLRRYKEYTEDLRKWIIDEKPPPPPKYPSDDD